MTSNEPISGRLRAFIEKTFPAGKERLMDDHASLLENGIIDSLGVLEIVGFIEEEFGIILTDDEMVAENFDSIAALTSLISQTLERKVADGLPHSSFAEN